MIHRLRRRFIRIAMLSVTLVLVLLIGSVNFFNILSVNRELDNMLSFLTENRGTMPESLPREPVPPVGKPDEIQASGTGKRPANFTPETPFSTRFFVLRYAEDGTLLDADLSHIASVSQEDAETYLTMALENGEGTGRKNGFQFRITALEDNSYLAVFLDCQREIHSVRTFALLSGAALLGCIVLVYVLILLFSRKATEPAARSLEKQKQFITDASHELKTPLTVLATSLRLLEMDVGPQKWLEKAQHQTENLGKLVNELVTLSRLDEENPPIEKKPFPLSDAVREVAESFQEYAAAEGRTLELELSPALTYQGDEYAIRQLVSILLDNAVKYSDENGTIRLRLEKTKKGVLLHASNTCPPMDPAEADKLFERFYRVDKARSRQNGSYGIGLSIARSIAENHRGSIRAECPSPEAITFTVTLN